MNTRVGPLGKLEHFRKQKYLQTAQTCLEGGLILLKLWVQIPLFSFYLMEGSFKLDPRLCAFFTIFFTKKLLFQNKLDIKIIGKNT